MTYKTTPPGGSFIFFINSAMKCITDHRHPLQLHCVYTSMKLQMTNPCDSMTINAHIHHII